jgi:hypothetical protein
LGYVREHSTAKKGHNKIEKVQKNTRGTFLDNLVIAYEFKKFFASLGINISNSVGDYPKVLCVLLTPFHLTLELFCRQSQGAQGVTIVYIS